MPRWSIVTRLALRGTCLELNSGAGFPDPNAEFVSGTPCPTGEYYCGRWKSDLDDYNRGYCEDS